MKGLPPLVSMDGEREEVEKAMKETEYCTRDQDELLCIRSEDVRKLVQCPICLGILRKTRTVMECMHQFCRECIDKAMRLGNNECPTCRTHCASHRSLRDDPTLDALIGMLFPDIDKYEQKQSTFNEEEKARNKMIQDSITEKFRWQPALLGKKSSIKSDAVSMITKSRKRGRGATRDVLPTGSEEKQRSKKSKYSSKARTAEERQIAKTEKTMQDSLNTSDLIAWGRKKVRSCHANQN